MNSRYQHQANQLLKLAYDIVEHAKQPMGSDSIEQADLLLYGLDLIVPIIRRRLKTYIEPISYIDKPAYLSGIYRLSYYVHPELEMKVYLLDDIHRYEYECDDFGIKSSMRVHHWIEQIVKQNSDILIDIFLEISPPERRQNIITDMELRSRYEPERYNEDVPIITNILYKQERSGDNSPIEFTNSSEEYTDIEARHTLSAAVGLFAPCWLSDKSKCPYPNTRVHWVDIRNASILRDIKRSIGIFDVTERETSFIKKLRQEPLDVLHKFMDGTKIRKQLDNMDPEIQQMLIKFMEDKVSKSEEYRHMSREFAMDIYLLARLFRTFKDGSYVQHAIIYTGGFHNNIYRQFFKMVGFQQVYNKETEFGNVQCLNIRDLPYPIFV